MHISIVCCGAPRRYHGLWADEDTSGEGVDNYEFWFCAIFFVLLGGLGFHGGTTWVPATNAVCMQCILAPMECGMVWHSNSPLAPVCL